MLPNYNEDQNSEKDEWDLHEEVSEEITQSSQDLRQMANTAFQNHDLDSALPLYNMAIDALIAEQDNNNHNNTMSIEEGLELMIIFLCNRSVCLHKMELYDDAKNDAMEAWRLSEGHSPKAAFRLAKAHLALKEFAEAIAVLKRAIDFEKKRRDEALAIAAQDKDKNKDKNKDVNKDINKDINKDGSTTISKSPIQELQKLLQTAHAHHLASKNIPHAASLSKLTTIIPDFSNLLQQQQQHQQTLPQQEQHQEHKPSIREFEMMQDLGEGNYSRVIAVKHSVTAESFALKIIEKKKVESLAKRQHPNVYNEIEMEKRILGIRLNEGIFVNNEGLNGSGDDDDDDDNGEDSSGGSGGICMSRISDGRRRIVNLYHTFQDYNNLYYLMDLCIEGGDMWSTLRHGDKMVGE